MDANIQGDKNLLKLKNDSSEDVLDMPECGQEQVAVPKIQFDHEGYRNDLELLIKYAYDEYRHITLERQRTQITYIQHYLWLSVIILGSGCKLFWELKAPIPLLSFLSGEPVLAYYILAAISIALSFLVIIVGVDTLRGRGKTAFPFGNVMPLAKIAYESAHENNVKPTLFTSIINSIDGANQVHSERLEMVGKRLRGISYALIISLVSGVFAIASRVSL